MAANDEPTTLLVCGDIHGDPEHLAYLYQVAADLDVDRMVQVGDFGYWEHVPGGDAFLEVATEGFRLTGVPLDWIDGNHESHTLLRARYGPGGPRHALTAEGFWVIRPGVHYIPRGTRWQWSGARMMGLGGAYSVDKSARLRDQRKDGIQRWWVEEEITDEDLAVALRSGEPLDVLFTHDVPRDVEVPWGRRGILLAQRNQDKIQKVVNTLHPKLLVHGHLHFRYRGKVDRTVVEGLACNPHQEDHDPKDSWIRLTLA